MTPLTRWSENLIHQLSGEGPSLMFSGRENPRNEQALFPWQNMYIYIYTCPWKKSVRRWVATWKTNCFALIQWHILLPKHPSPIGDFSDIEIHFQSCQDVHHYEPVAKPPNRTPFVGSVFSQKKRVFPPVVSGTPNRGVVRPACLGGHLRSKVSLSISGASPNVGVVPPWRWNPTGKRSLAYAPAETAIKQTVTIPRTQRSTSNFWRSTPQNKAVPTKTRVIWILGIGSNVVG